MSARIVAGAVLALLLAGAMAGGARAAARLELAGWPGGEREAGALFAPALRAPGDSIALASALRGAEAALQSGGWLSARVHAGWAQGNAALRVRAEAGPRARWGTLALEVPPEDSAAFAAQLAWRPGTVAGPAALTEAVTRAVDAAVAGGHAWARLGVSGWSEDSGRVNVRLSGSRGPVVTISQLRFEGLRSTRADVVARAAGRLEGRPYDPAAVRAAGQRLAQLGVFRRVEYLDLASTGDWRRGILRWKVEEPRYNTFEGAVGLQGGGTAVGLAKLDLGNVLGTARAVSLAWQSRGRGLTDFGARYAEPLVLGSPLRLELALQQQVQDTVYTRFRWGAKARTALGTRETIEGGFEKERVVQTTGEVRSADLSSVTFGIERDARDDAGAPRRGTWSRLAATQTDKREVLRSPSATRDARTSAVELRGEWHRPLRGAQGVTLELRAAGRFVSQGLLADWERWPLGGAASLRGHDEEAYRVDRFALSRAEWRYFLGTHGERLEVFWDHAEMQTRRPLPAGGDRMSRQSADGIGFGMRLPAAGGMVDLDYGLEPGRGFLDGKIHLRLVTAF
ncbi:MAG: BamA/TamA family outer membrane protein [Candidatus Eisenbacteria bacterium]|nr:BamA/TamA family outer membrane protein [Candidatus Eisenbacteria bacterium]